MPKCLNCGSVVSKDDIRPNPEDVDSTTCSFCSEFDSSDYRFQLSVSDRGVGLSGATPHGEFSASVPWSDIKRLSKKRDVSIDKNGNVTALPDIIKFKEG